MLACTSFVGQLGRKVTNMISCQLIEFHSIGSRENFGKEYNWKGKPLPSKYVFEAEAYTTSRKTDIYIYRSAAGLKKNLSADCSSILVCRKGSETTI